MKEDLNELDQSEFLTGPQLRGIPVPPGVMMNADARIEKELEYADMNLHNEAQFISKERKNEIDAEIDKYISKNTLAEERIQKEVETATKKYDKAPNHPRNILADLLSKGELRKSYDGIAKHKWTLRALDEGDILLAMDDLQDSIQTEAGRLSSVVFSKVVYSIEAIDDIPIYEFFPEIQPQKHPSKIDYIITVKRALRSYLLGMAPKIIDLLYYKYIELEEERDKALDNLKNS